MISVLIVDDSQIARYMLTGYLTPAGYSVETAVSGKEALEKLASKRFDAVILDLLMPEMSGLDVLAEMAKTPESPPVIVLSADIQDSTRKRALELGAAIFLNKPPAYEVLQRAIQKVTEA